MNLQEFQDHARKNVVDYQKVVEALVKTFEDVTKNIDNIERVIYTKDTVNALNDVLEKLVKKHTHEPDEKY